MPSTWADTVVVIGRIGRPYGIKGWVHLQSYTEPSSNLIEYRPWLIKTSSRHGWEQRDCLDVRAYRQSFVGLFAGIEDRTEAAKLSGGHLGVPVETFPEPKADEYYWHQLIGLPVINENKVALGIVDDVMSTGANDVLVVKNVAGERLLPFVANTVVSVQLGDSILVRWPEDWG